MKHLVGVLHGPVINFTSELEIGMKKVAHDCEFTVVNQAFHQFQPIGVTGVLVLAESHFSAHTYPENNLTYIDVFCCSPTFNPALCASSIEKRFGGYLEWSVIDR
jgi:S-adenosylmethionine decarboxylase